MRASPVLALLMLTASPSMAQEQTYPVPDAAAQRALQRQLPSVIGALEERVIADCEAAALGSAACLEVLAWAAGESWSRREARTDYAARAVTLAETHLAADDPRRATAYIAMARAVEGPTSDNLDCEKPCPAIVAAQPWLDKAKTVLEAATPRDHLALALAYRELGGNLYAQGKRVEGDALTDRMLDTLVAGLPDTYARLRREIDDLIYNIETTGQQYARAEAMHRMRIAATEAVSGEGATLAGDYAAFGRNLARQGMFEAAGQALDNAIALSTVHASDDFEFVVSLLVERSVLAEAVGETERAITLMQRAMELAGDRTVEDGLGLPLRVRLGRLLEQVGRSDEAQPLLVEAYIADPDNIETLSTLAQHLAKNGAPEKAETLYRGALAKADAATGFDAAFADLSRAYLRMGLGRLLLEQGKIEEAEAELSQGIVEWQRTVSWHTAFLDLRFLLAEAKLRLKRPEDALSQLAAASAQTSGMFGSANPLRIDTDRRAATMIDERLGLHPAAWTYYARAASGAKNRIDSYTSFDNEAQRELRGYRPLFLQQVEAAWRYSERGVDR
ncbi:hypothetical protein T8S45_02325 [Blastomonas marina]|uniref:tetratricopeptide repeat protein n=1 Tax=Blastomonas marina TaxID=1867408 RepID=UPI002AC92393|nr:tetratricopeptide repeat protein [Blastomonas marina]WPZ04394.1 hypothetical protein T8S45_02325 [Blastomonas marina]